MMKLKKELPLIVIVLLPFVYLAYIWNQIPERVPIHWNIHGEIDRYGVKLELLIIPILLPLLMYLIFLIIPKIDPKNNLQRMGNKLQTLKVLLTSGMSLLALYILHLVKSQSHSNFDYVILSIGITYIILGNYFQAIRTNYFIGIRTPWTLRNESTWKKTHKLAGKMWFIGGVLVVLSVLFLNFQASIVIFGIVTAIIVIYPIIYSYVVYNQTLNLE